MPQPDWNVAGVLTKVRQPEESTGTGLIPEKDDGHHVERAEAVSFAPCQEKDDEIDALRSALGKYVDLDRMSRPRAYQSKAAKRLADEAYNEACALLGR